MTKLLRSLRCAFWALLALASIVLQWLSGHPGEEVFSVGGFHFVSYFTIQTNLLIAIWFSARALQGGADWWGSRGWRLAITGYAMVTMIVFWVLLAPTYHPTGWGIPANYGLHLVIPLAMIAEWLLDRPRVRLTWKSSVLMLLYPLLYCVYALTVGFTTGWFSYFFLDVPQQGPVLTGAYIGGLVGFFALVAFSLAALWNVLVPQAPVPSRESQTTAP